MHPLQLPHTNKSKCGNVSAVSKGIGDANSRRKIHNVTWFGWTPSPPNVHSGPPQRQSLRHQVSSDHCLALTTKAPGKQRLSATKSPRQGRRHRLSRSPRLKPSSSSELLHQEGVSGPRTSAVPLHTKSEGPPAITKICLPQQGFDTQGCSLKN